ncbi:hypothetical protein DSM104443_02318 [Usitatibacter rugosus]|uniref:WD40 repeat protein n=1 Tax=Usitatibacter rugosus TaxID=2732067 RepID=A0A6M4GW61_9PROT|nr:hypothetical protein [Usitatibacter rugosus]QJR11245.1 hypothetical protein DSM104443_02318 [Usitatibacter rugosus]
MWRTLLAALFLVSTPLLASEQPIAVREDLARGMRWELRWGSVTAYDIASGQRLRVVALTGASLSGAHESCLPDMLLGRTGTLIVSSNAQPVLWRISPSRFEVERLEIAVDSDAEKDFGFTSLRWGENEKVIYAGASTGTTWRIDLASGSGRKVSDRVRSGDCRAS